MAPRYLLDTNMCIYIRRRRPPEIQARFSRLRTDEAAISLITYGELMYGAAKLRPAPPRAAEQIQEFLDLMEILPLPVEAGRKYGEIRALLESKGQVIGNNDLWIAAHAMCADLTVVTNNEREFRRVPDLKIENWAK
jgi:tRNA(fMet)-specific endonuclease VapC